MGDERDTNDELLEIRKWIRAGIDCPTMAGQLDCLTNAMGLLNALIERNTETPERVRESPHHEGPGDPQMGSRHWRCEKELEKLRAAARLLVDADLAYRRECYPGALQSKRREREATRSHYLDKLADVLGPPVPRTEPDQRSHGQEDRADVSGRHSGAATNAQAARETEGAPRGEARSRGSAAQAGVPRVESVADHNSGTARTQVPPPGRWRVGRSLGRTIYAGDGCIGMVDTPELATAIVDAMNDRGVEGGVAQQGSVPDKDRSLASARRGRAPADKPEVAGGNPASPFDPTICGTPVLARGLSKRFDPTDGAIQIEFQPSDGATYQEAWVPRADILDPETCSTPDGCVAEVHVHGSWEDFAREMQALRKVAAAAENLDDAGISHRLSVRIMREAIAEWRRIASASPEKKRE